MCMHQSQRAKNINKQHSSSNFNFSSGQDNCEYIDIAKRINSNEQKPANNTPQYKGSNIKAIRPQALDR